MAEAKPSVWQNIKSFIKAITVEPVAFLFLTGSVISSTASNTLALDKTCRVNLNLSEAICDALRNQDTDDNADNERIVQQYVAGLLGYKSIISSVLPCLLLIFAGGWMDITGRRKIMIILPALGEILQQTNNIFNVVLFFELNVEYLIFSEAALSNMFGGNSVLFLAAFSYIVDITSEENRTHRLGIVNFCISIGMPVGSALSGFFLKSFGYLTVYIISLTMAVINMVYLVFFLSDPVRTKEQKKNDNRGLAYFLKTFFSPAHLLNSLKVVFKKTGNNRAVKLCILLGTTCFLIGPLMGESAVIYMSTRFRFGWDELQYSLYQAFNSVVGTIGAIITILFISKKLGCDDSVLGILATISKICSAFVFGLATAGYVFYIGAVVDMVHASSFIAIRSTVSKTVEPHEVAKMISISSIMEVLLPLAFVPLYAAVYSATMEVLPGLVFLMGVVLTIPALLVFIWLLYLHMRNVKMQKINELTQL